MLRGTETPVCHPDRLSREVCCLLGAHIVDIKKRILGMIQLDDCYTFLVFQAGSHEVATRKGKNVKKVFMSLGKMLKGPGAQVLFSSVLPVEDWDLGRRRKDQYNEWLCGWCHVQGFGFHHLGCTFKLL